MAIIKPIDNVPVQVTFKYEDFRERTGEYGTSYQYGVATADSVEPDVIFADAKLHMALQASHVHKGAIRTITKTKGPDGKTIVWKVEGNGQATPAQQTANQQAGAAPTQGQSPKSPPVSVLICADGVSTMREFILGMGAAWKEWAEFSGKDYTSEDVRACAISLSIWAGQHDVVQRAQRPKRPARDVVDDWLKKEHGTQPHLWVNLDEMMATAAMTGGFGTYEEMLAAVDEDKGKKICQAIRIEIARRVAEKAQKDAQVPVGDDEWNPI